MPSLSNRATIPHPVARMFGLALALERYPEILWYIHSVEIIDRVEDTIHARLRFGLGPLIFGYRRCITHRDNEWIHVVSDDAMFRGFEAHCEFTALDTHRTEIRYNLRMRFANPLLEMLATRLMPAQSRRTMQAFVGYLAKA